MPEDKSVEIARLSYKQAIAVACIAAVAGILTTLIASGTLQRSQSNANLAGAIGDGRVHEAATTSSDASSGDLEQLRERVRASERIQQDLRARLVDALRRPADPAAHTATPAEGLRAELESNREKWAATERGLKSEMTLLKEERDALRQSDAKAPEIHSWTRPLTMPVTRCLSRGTAALVRAGIKEQHSAGVAVYGDSAGTKVIVECDHAETVLAASHDGAAAEAWRDKVRDAFLAQHD